MRGKIIKGSSDSNTVNQGVASLQNIANVHVGRGIVTSDADVATIVDILSGGPGALTIVEIAKRLAWDSAKTANALERGGKAGVLSFYENPSGTMVTLK